MNMGMRGLAVLLPLLTGACARTSTVESSAPEEAVVVAPDVETSMEPLRLESLYSNTSIHFMNDAPPAHFVSMTLTAISPGEMTGTLALDPNACGLDELGERQGCTRMAMHVVDVDVRLVRIDDSARPGLGLFQIAGEGLPDELALIVRGDLEKGELERGYLKLGAELVPMYLADDR